jgi:acyl carrier protein
MLRAVRREQLEAIIARTSVPEEHRRAFLGQAAAAMLAALGIVAGRPGVAEAQQPPAPLKPGGIRPDMPELRNKPKTIEQRVISVIATQLQVDELRITTQNKGSKAVSLVDDLEATAPGLVKVRKGLEKEFSLKIPAAAFKRLHTVGETVDYVKKAMDKRKPAAKPTQETPAKAADLPQPPQPPSPDSPPIFVGGVRPD